VTVVNTIQNIGKQIQAGINAVASVKKTVQDLWEGIKQVGQKMKDFFSKQTGKEKELAANKNELAQEDKKLSDNEKQLK
jgi:uncharacterized protein YoxC